MAAQATNTGSADQNIRQRQWLFALTIALFAIVAAIVFQGREDKAIIPRIFNKIYDDKNISSISNIQEEPLSSNDEEECSCVVENPATVDTASFASSLGLQGNVSDCCCSFSDIEQANLETVHPLLQKVVQTPFFSHFKIDLCSSCKLWDDAPLCILRDCGVCECEEPPEWANDVEWMPHHVGPDCEHLDDRVVTIVDDHVQEDWTAEPKSFLDINLNDRTEEALQRQENGGDSNAVVVDLKINPERFTAYSGQSAERVWSAIHNDNCFQSENDNAGGVCTLTPEQRVYNRIISGLHSSISLHIAHSYCLEVDPEHSWECKKWGPNATLANERVLGHTDRLENLYVAFAMVLRAVQKAGPAVTAAVPVEDSFFSESLTEWTESLLPELTKLEHSCPVTFDESSLFPDDDGNNSHDSKAKRLELQRRFRHLQEIMECVGCDRCKLWGTLQTLGIGTALRVLLSDHAGEVLTLSRQEAVALVHTLERLSSSLVYASEFRM